jgi:hypothetical protein
LFLQLLKRIIFAKNKHAKDHDTLGAQKESGNDRGHSFHGTRRGRLRKKCQDALMRAMHSHRLVLQMDDAIALDHVAGKHWHRNSDSLASKLWDGWRTEQRKVWEEHRSILSDYQRSKEEYASLWPTCVAKKCRR